MLPYSIVKTTLVFIFIHHVHSLDQPPRVTRPPTIIPGLDTDVIYFDPSQKYKPELPCSAIGNDPKTFEWTKNGKLMKIDKYNFEWTKNGQIVDFKDRRYISNSTNKPRIVRMDKHTGRIQLTELRDDDAGVYRCITKNTFGTSLSQKIRLVESTTRAFTNPQQERKYRVLAANNLKLQCNPPENDPPGSVNWLKYQDGGEGTRRVDLDNRIAQDGEGNLYFANVQKSDENDGQKYVCQVELSNNGVYITGAFSIISVDDGQPGAQFPVELAYQSQKEVTALKDRYITFQCIFTGNPTPSIQWVRKTGGKIDKSRMREDSTKFRIKKVQYEDEGTYECIGTNSVSSARGIRRTFNLKVLSKPEWTAKPQKVDAGEEEQAVFECSADGRPPPKVQWFINGEPIESLSSNPRRILSDGQLRFTDLTRDDAQVVQCNVSNKYGSLWADVALSILAFQPEIKTSFQQIKVSEGGVVTLPCEIDGKPKPLIFWKRGNQKIEGPRFRQKPTGNLTILNSTMSDEGNWTCFAENKYGKLNSSGVLIVRMQTKIDMPPLPPKQRIRFGSATTFKCAASTDPDEMGNLEISWLKDGEPLDLNNPRIIKNGNEIIINGSTSEDTGKYTCVASNKLDSDTASAQLEVTAPPDPPTDVSFSSCLSRSAIVSWKPGFDNFSPITKFYVEYNHSYAPDIWTKAAVVSDATKAEASVKLSPHANYTFRVIAENNFGKSKPSERSIAMCDTNPARPDKNPGNLRTDRSRPEWLIIKWDEMKPIEHNGDDFRYNLTIRKDGMINRTTISDWQETTKEIYIGKVYEPYEMHIEAWNEKGKSGDMAVIHIGYTGEGELLSSPSDFEIVPGFNVTDKVAVFQWNPIDTSPDKVQGEFKGYKIRFWKLGQRNTTQKTVEISRQPEIDSRIKRDVTKETGTVQTLYPNSMVMADVVAMNTYFESEPSNVVTFETPEGVPGRVKKARVVTRGAHHFLIEWEEPEEPNGNLTGYEIGYRKVDGFDLGEIMDTTEYNDPDRSRAFLGNLDANQEYNIYIWAKTNEGLGDKYYFDAKTANSGPLIVPEMTIEVVGEDFVNVSWNVNPMEDAPAGAYHYVQFRELGKGDWDYSADEKINNWINVSGLVPNTQYEISVVAATDLVQSPSQVRKILTKGEAMQSATETNLAQTPWFIVMMVLIAVLILFLIIICFIKRSRGEKYNVQEREKLRGNDIENPDKDLFNEYPKSSETDPLAAGSPDSFDNEGDKLPGGSETDSMAEYGDVDPSKFNEDGSFIGQYGSQKPDEKGNQPSAMSTFV